MSLRRRLVTGALLSLPLAGAAAILMQRDEASPSTLRGLYSTLFADPGVSVERNISYGPHSRHRLDVYRPSGRAGVGPIAVFIYGGAWRDGHRSDFGFVGAALAARGVTTVIPDYRLFPEVTFPAFVEDAAQAYLWTLKTLAVGDSGIRPIVLVGHSAGAHIAALLALDKRYLQRLGSQVAMPSGLVGLAGPYAFDPTTWPSTRAIFANVTDARAARPISFVRGDAPPALLMHGLDDTVVRLWNLRTLARDLERTGARVRTRVFENVGHVGIVLALSRPFRWRAPVLSETLDFIETVGR